MIGLLVFLAASCATDGPVVPTAIGPLVGEWTSVRESMAGDTVGSWQRTLVVSGDGRVVHRGVSYGLYPGQTATDVSAEVALYGRLAASNGAFVIRADSLVMRDRVSGTFVRTVQRAPIDDSVRYALCGDTLSLGYLESPAEMLVRRR